MSYAKACKYGCGTQIIWDKVNNRFNENATGEPHTREKCEAKKTGGLGKYSPQQQKEFVEQYRPEQKAQASGFHLNENNAMAKLDMILDKLNYIINHNPSERENQILKQKVTELEEVIKKQGNNFVPANQVLNKATALGEEDESQQEHDQHVRDMVKKGEQAAEEELDLT